MNRPTRSKDYKLAKCNEVYIHALEAYIDELEKTSDKIMKLLQEHQDIEISAKYLKDYGLKIQMYSDKTDKIDSKIINEYDLKAMKPDILQYNLDTMLAELSANKE